MGWCGYGIYSGDDTQTCHLSYLEWLGFKLSYEEDILGLRKTKLTIEMKESLAKNYGKILKKMPKLCQLKISKVACFKDEDDAIQWQMLLALFIDAGVTPPKKVYDLGIMATEVLMLEHAFEFDYPGKRRQVLRQFIKKAKKVGYS